MAKVPELPGQTPHYSPMQHTHFFPCPCPCPKVLKRKHTFSSPPLPLTPSPLVRRQLMSSLKYSLVLQPCQPFCQGTRTQRPISEITFMPLTPPNVSPDLTSQRFCSHTVSLLPAGPPATRTCTRTCPSAKMALSVTPVHVRVVSRPLQWPSSRSCHLFPQKC